MKKRQFGNKRLVYASDQNIAQDYVGSNIEEIISDGKIYGIISGGDVLRNAYIKYTVTLQSLVARTSTGQRISVDSTENIFIKPLFNPGTGKEIWVTAYAIFVDKEEEVDVDGDGNIYYKDYQNNFQIKVVQGPVGLTGNATRTSIPANSILICDVLYNDSLYISGWIQQANIDVTRQKFYADVDFDELIVEKTSEFGGEATFLGGVSMQGGPLNKDDEHIPGGSSVLNRNENDDRYVNLSGDTMTGTLSAPNITVTNDLTAKSSDFQSDVTVSSDIESHDMSVAIDVHTASLDVGGRIVSPVLHSTDDVSVSGNIEVLENATIHNQASIGELGRVHTIHGTLKTSSGDVLVSGDVEINGNAVVGGSAQLRGGANISSGVINSGLLTIANGGSTVNGNISVGGYIITSSGIVDSNGVNIEWKSSTGYVVNDIVSTTVNTSTGLYRCKLNHTSSSNFLSDLPLNWDAFVNTTMNVPTSTGIDNFSLFATSTGSSLKDTVSASTVGWITSGSMVVGLASGGGSGVYNAALAFGGDQTLAHIYDYTQEFNGSSWSMLPQLMQVSRVSFGSAGATKNSAVAFSGLHQVESPGSLTLTTEIWNGSTWSFSGDMPYAGFSMSGCGVVNNALASGGTYSVNSSTGYLCLLFNGSTWSITGYLNYPRIATGAFGTTSAATSFKGGADLGSPGVHSENFNGASWSISGDASVAALGPYGAGVQSSGFSINGLLNSSEPITCTEAVETYNGSTWSTSPNSSNIKRWVSVAAGSSSQAANWGGDDVSGHTDYTEVLGATYTYTVVSSMFSPASFGVTNGDNHDHVGGDGGSIKEASFSLSDVSGVDTWSAGGNLNTVVETHAGAGIKNAALSFGGDNGSVVVAITEKFDGSTWSTNGGWNLNSGRMYTAGSGLQTAALSFGGASGGVYVATTEKFNGSVWTTDAGWNLLTARGFLGGAGIQSATISCVGHTDTVFTDISEKFNGSTWSSGHALSILRDAVACSGSMNSTLCFGGSDSSSNNTALTEKYDGSSWSTTGSLNTARRSLAGCGTSSVALCFGGIGGSSVVEKFNSIAWYTATNLLHGVYSHAGVGTQSSAIRFGGIEVDTPVRSSEIFTGSTSANVSTSAHGFLPKLPSTKQLNNYFRGLGLWTPTYSRITSTGIYIYGSSAYEMTTDTFSSTGVVPLQFIMRNTSDPALYMDMWTVSESTNVPYAYRGGAGTQNTALAFGGYFSAGTYYAVTEKFNGSTWTGTGSMNTARFGLAGVGVQNAALGFGGYAIATSQVTEKFNSSAWTATGNLNTARYTLAGAGVQNSAVSAGGTTGSVSAVVESFNGSTWTNLGSGALNTARMALASAGTFNSALVSGGYTTVAVGTTERFNGVAWVSVGALNTARWRLAGTGVSNSALDFGGDDTTDYNISEKYNGISWFTTGNLIIGKCYPGDAGVQNAALCFGGLTPSSGSAETEKFIGRVSLTLNAHVKSDKLGSFSALGSYSFSSFFTKNASMHVSVKSPAHIIAWIGVDPSLSREESAFLRELGTEKISVGSWTVSSPLNTARLASAGLGVQTAALNCGGYNGTDLYMSLTEKYNGSTWAYVTSFTSGGKASLAACGTTNSGLIFGGLTEGTEKFNGSSWTYSATWNQNVPRQALAGAGVTNAALGFGGDTGSSVSTSEKFNGNSWTTTGNLNTARIYLGGSGRQNNALSFGGMSGPVLGTTEKYNGLVWLTVNSLNISKSMFGGAGIQSSALSFGGYTGSIVSSSERFTGSFWSVTRDLNIACYYNTGCGSAEKALSFGGTPEGTSGPWSYMTEQYIENLGYATPMFSWSTTGNMLTGRRAHAGVGKQAATLAISGLQSGSGTPLSSTEVFNGSSWSASVNINTARSYLSGAGVITSAISFGGIYTSSVSAVTEIFNGSSWRATGSLNTARSTLAGVGNVNAGLSFGGIVSSASNVTETFFFDTWTVSGTLNNTRYSLSGSGYKNAAMAMGGISGSSLNSTEVFNGSTWANSVNLNSLRDSHTGAGSQSRSMVMGGTYTIVPDTFYLATTEKWNGGAWRVSESISRPRWALASSGAHNAALVFGGAEGSVPLDAVQTTEKYLYSSGYGSYEAWFVTGSINTSRLYLAGAGHQNASLSFGGSTSIFGSPSGVTEKFLGSVWSSTTSLSTPRSQLGGCGTLNAALSFGGYTTTSTGVTEEYDGFVWSNSGNLNTLRYGVSGTGIQTAAISVGGTALSNIVKVTEKYNGGSWSATGSLNNARTNPGVCGIQGAALAFCGYPYQGTSEKFNGTTWSNSENLNIQRYVPAGVGANQNAGLVFGGEYGGSDTYDSSEKYNGSAWYVSSFMNYARYGASGGGSSVAALGFGGYLVLGSFVGPSEKLINTLVSDYVADTIIGAKIDLLGRMNLYDN